MGNLDGRIEQGKSPSPDASGGVKDGPTGLAAKKAPSKADRDDQAPDKASDVVSQGVSDPGTAPSNR